MGIERILASSERDFVAKSVDYIEEGVLQGGGEGRPAVLLGEGRWFQCISNVFHAEKTAKYLTRGEVVDGVTPKWRRLVRGHDKNNYMGSWAESTFQVVYIYDICIFLHGSSSFRLGMGLETGKTVGKLFNTRGDWVFNLSEKKHLHSDTTRKFLQATKKWFSGGFFPHKPPRHGYFAYTCLVYPKDPQKRKPSRIRELFSLRNFRLSDRSSERILFLENPSMFTYIYCM